MFFRISGSKKPQLLTVPFGTARGDRRARAPTIEFESASHYDPFHSSKAFRCRLRKTLVNRIKYRQFEDLYGKIRQSLRVACTNSDPVASSTAILVARSARPCRVVVSNNIAERLERGSTSELLAFLYIARGSAGEVRSMLKVLEGWSDFSNLKSHISDLISQSENISRQLYGWIESLKYSDISGQRHLDEKARIRYSTKQSRQDFLEELDRINLTEAEKRQSKHKPS